MARKAAARGRKGTGRPAGSAGRTAPKSAAHATSRTGKKTASARASHAPTAVAQRGRPARKTAAHAPERELTLEESRLDQVRGQHTEEDEDLDWLKEDEDPRSQIVEDDDEEEPHDRENW